MVQRAAHLVLLLVVVLHVVATPTGGQTHPFRIVVGYYVNDDSHSLQTLEAQSDQLSQIITTNHNLVDPRGTLRGLPDPGVVDLAHQRGIRVQFRVANVVNGEFRPEIAHAVLVDPAAQARAIAQMLVVLDAQDYDGINIDLEGLPAGDRAALTRFVESVSAAVHSRGKLLSIAVPGTVEDRPEDDWSGVFDMEALGRLSDYVIVMAYDEHWSGSAPGPVASLPWVEAVARFAVSQVPWEKVLLGIPFYGYEWREPGTGEGITSREAVVRAARAGAEIQWDERAKVPYYRLETRIAYFENARSAEEKLAVALRLGLAGVSVWRLGQELPDTWQVIRAYVEAPVPVSLSERTRPLE